ncbi:MAG: S8 family serine peptidase [Anaerolineae bacterium]
MKLRLLISLLLLGLLAPGIAAARAPVPAAPALQLSTTSAHRAEPSVGIPLSMPTLAQAPAVSAQIEPSLLKKLLSDDGEDMLRAIVMMRAQAGRPAAALAATADRAARVAIIRDDLQSLADRSQGAVRSLLARGKQEGQVRDYHPLWIVNAVAVEARAEMLWALASRPDVSVLLEDRVHVLSDPAPVPSAEGSGEQWNVTRIGADRVWQSLGLTGEGTVVASIDTGVDWEHPLLKSRYRGYSGKPLVEHEGNWYCATDEGYTYPGDGYGHGTHTTGIMVGEDGIGVAPGAQWIAAKVFDNQGRAYDSWIHAGLEWALAPGGDPSLAPDVVNCSWGDPTGTNTRFLPDVQALRAAGIAPVFSAGNYGPQEGTITAPGSFRESIAVGATDSDDRTARFSSRGPSPWDEIKPELGAPGVGILSTVPGGGLGPMSGTSMAAPHVSGIVALLRQANPALTVDELEAVMLGTARPLGEVQPNNELGWGLSDAYAAAVVAGSFGYLSGYVTDAASGVPLASCLVQATAHGGAHVVSTVVDASGSYTLGLGADLYDVTFTTFGYEAHTVYGIEVRTGETTSVDASLLALSTGELTGHVRQLDPDQPLAARVYVPGTDAGTVSSASDGAYTLALPAGTHDVRVEAEGYRFLTGTVTIAANETTVANFDLAGAPSILLVDSGAWYNGSQITYYRKALEELHYLYDEHDIVNVDTPPTDVPTTETLQPYDVVIWSAPLDSPGYIGASAAITGFLSSGGRLLLSGQDVAFWDGGGSGAMYSSYLEDYFRVRLAADEAPTHTLLGEGTLFAGLAITLGGPGSADNQDSPDVIATSDADYSSTAWRYKGDGLAAQAVGPCLPYRTLFYGFGIEGIGSPEARSEVLGRSIDWLTAPPDPAGVEIVASTEPQIAPAGGWFTHAMRLRNTGEVAPDTLALNLQPGAWPLVESLPPVLTLGACQSTTLSMRVEVPPETGWHTYDTLTVTVTSTLSPALSAETTLSAKTPAPLLLVDGSRFYQVDDHYRAALESAGIAYDLHRVKGVWPIAVPSAETLAMYPMVAWYTAYDWYQPLSPVEEQRLIGYLDGGGRLLLSSQDYLYYGHDGTLAETYLGVLTHVEDLETTLVWGETPHPIGWGAGPYALNYSYTNWSDGLRTVPGAKVALRGQHGLPAAITQRGPGWRTVFAAFPFETLDAEAAQTLIDRTVGWLSWLGSSTWQADRRVIASGSEVTMTCTLHNDGWSGIAAHLTAPLPPELDLIEGSLDAGATYYAPTRTVAWEGTLGQLETITVSFRVRAGASLPASTSISFPVTLSYAEHEIEFELPYILQVSVPDLSASTVAVTPSQPTPLQPLTYVLHLRNAGLSDTTVTVSGALPKTASFDGAIDSGGIGAGYAISRTLQWSGPVPAGEEIVLTYHAVPNDETDYWLIHDVRIADQSGERWYLEARARFVPYRLYFPFTAK